MMRKLIAVLSVFAILFVNMAVLADDPVPGNIPDLDAMTIDELLQLQKDVAEKLNEKGYIQYTELEHGAKGDDVLDVQSRLRELGYYTGTLNSKFDSETQKAFKLFEKNNDLKNDGIASQNDLVILFSSSALPKQAPVTEAPEKEKAARGNPDLKEGYLPFSDFDYTEYFRYPEQYMGTKITLRGKVLQVLGSRKRGYSIRLATSGGYNDVVYVKVSFDPGYNILEGDTLIVYATMEGTYSYTATLLNTVTVPSAKADSIELK